MKDVHIILASASPRRRELLERLGWRFDVIPSDADETKTMGEAPEQMVMRLAKLKGEKIAARFPESIVISADTAVVLSRENATQVPSRVAVRKACIRYAIGQSRHAGAATYVPQREIFGKPKDNVDALRMLKNLSGRAHDVFSGLALFWRGTVLCDFDRTRVVFREMSPEFLENYVATGEPLGKAGAYAIQGRGSLLVERIDGDYSTVVGLPVCLLGKMIEKLGFDPASL